MSKVYYQGSSLINKSVVNNYNDTIFTTFISDDGNYELVPIEKGKFSTRFSESDTESWRTCNILSQSGYNLLALRNTPWKSEVLNTYSSVKSGSSYIVLIDKLEISSFNFIRFIFKSGNRSSIICYNSTEDYEYIPDSFTGVPYKLTSNVDQNEILLSKDLLNNNIVFTIEDDQWKFRSDIEFYIEYGQNRPVYDYTSLRIFSNDVSTANHPDWTQDLPNEAYVYSIDSDDNIILKFNGYDGELDFASPNSLVFEVSVKVGDIVTRSSVLYNTNYASYPLKSVNYSTGNSTYKVRDTHTRNYTDLVDPIKSDVDGVVVLATDNKVRIRKTDGSEKTYLNTQNTIDYLSVVVFMGDIIKKGDILFNLDQQKLKKNSKLNMITYAAKLKLSSKYNVGDYFLLNLGSKNKLVLFARVNLSGNVENLDYLLSKVDVSNTFRKSYDIIPLNYYVDHMSYDYTVDQLNKSLKSLYQANGFISSLDENYVYFRRQSVFKIINQSNFTNITQWDEGMYDTECYMRDSNSIISFYSKNPCCTENIRILISKNKSDFNYPDIGYNVQIMKYSGNLLTASESFTFDLSSDGYYSYKKINSKIVTISLDLGVDMIDSDGNPNEKAILVDGEYVLSRCTKRDITPNMMKANISNVLVKPTDYEIFMDSGLNDIDYINVCWKKLSSHNNLMLFDLENPDSINFSWMYNVMKNSSFSYPDVYINSYRYPNYVSWLMITLGNQYTGDVSISGLSSNEESLHKDNLMTIFYDDYRYVLSHNYINSYVGKSFNEMILVLSRIRNYLYCGIDYQLGEYSIRQQFNSISNIIMNISLGSLMKIVLSKLEVTNRICKMEVLLYFNYFRVDPINLKVEITI